MPLWVSRASVLADAVLAAFRAVQARVCRRAALAARWAPARRNQAERCRFSTQRRRATSVLLRPERRECRLMRLFDLRTTEPQGGRVQNDCIEVARELC